MYGRIIHTTIIAGCCARATLQPLKLEPRRHTLTPYSSAADRHCSASVPPRERTVTTYSLWRAVSHLFPEVRSCIRHLERLTAVSGTLLLRHLVLWCTLFTCTGEPLCWSGRCASLSCSIKLDVALSTSANTPVKTSNIPVHIPPRL